jgi:fibronectin type 3 domain-containing protein
VEIYDSNCENNTFHHNNFINGTVVNVTDSGANTTWDDGSGEGNYWSNYTGLDDGSDGRVAGDGIGDTNIPHMGLDNYPLMTPWGVPPTIISVTPQNLATNIPVTTNIEVIFSEPMNQTSTQDAFTLETGGDLVSGTFDWNLDNDRMTFDPTANLFWETRYWINITTEARDLLGDSLSSPWTSSFTTEKDITPPTITDITAIPDPQEIYGYVNISANVSDSVGVDTVLIGIMDPNGGIVGNFTTSYDSVNDRYYKNQTYDIVGMYQFIIWANDTSNNWNFSSGQFTMQDTTLPTITDITSMPELQEAYHHVNVSANVSDNVDVDTVWINITDPNGNTMGNFTMTHDPVNDRYYKNQTYDIVGMYQFIIWANDTSNNWNFSSGQFTMQDTPPATPTGLIVTDVPNDEGGALNITWDLNTDDTVVYSLYSNMSGSWQFLVNVTHPQNWYVDTELTDNVKYYYKISAWDEVPNESPLSDATYGIPTDNLPPATPSGLTVSQLASGDLNIAWDANTEPDLDHYTLYSNKTGLWAFLIEIPAGIEYYVDTGLTHGATYYYNISASDEVPNESPQSTSASNVSSDILPPATPTGLTITSLRSGDLNITWNLNTDDTQTYSIYSNKTGTWTLLVNITHPQNWYIGTGLTSGTTYYYKISAWDEVSLESLISEAIHGVSSPMGTISGVVEDKGGNPIEGVTVTIYEDGTTINPVTFATTNSNGEYSVDLPPSIYDVKSGKSGYETQWEKDVDVAADQTTTVDFTLPRTTDLLGDYWWLILLIIIVIIIIIIVILIAKKKRPVEEAEGEKKPVEVTEEEEPEEKKAEEYPLE